MIDIGINLLYYIIINIYINNRFIWIKNTNGKISSEEQEHLSKNVKAMFFHKIGYLVISSTDNIVISKFINLATVGIFNSYNMIITSAKTLISTGINGVTASIGNLLVEKDSKDKAFKIHKILFFITFWLISFVTISLYNTLHQFVRIWLGSEQSLDRITLAIILINFYFSLMRSSVERFKDGAGLYYNDRYAPVFESVVNLVSSIVLVNIIGLPGVFLGTLISNITVVFWIKPKMVYKYVFNKPLKNYFIMYLKFLFIGLIPLVITNFLCSYFKEPTVSQFIINCTINVVSINGIYLLFFWNNEEFKYIKNIIYKFIKKNNSI